MERVNNPDVLDLDNTLLKMADKRAMVAATLLATGCSDIFTQDLEDAGEPAQDVPPAEPAKDGKVKPKAKTAAPAAEGRTAASAGTLAGTAAAAGAPKARPQARQAAPKPAPAALTGEDIKTQLKRLNRGWQWLGAAFPRTATHIQNRTPMPQELIDEVHAWCKALADVEDAQPAEEPI